MYRGRKTTTILLVCFLYLGVYSVAHAQSSNVIPTIPSALNATSIGTDANSACIYDNNKQKLVWVSGCTYPTILKGTNKVCGAKKQCSGKKVIGGKSLQVTGYCEYENDCKVESFIDENNKVQKVTTPDIKPGETQPSTEVPKETDTAADVPKTDPDKQYTPVKCSFGDCKAVAPENQYTPVSCSGGTCEATKISPSASKLQDWLGGGGVAQSSPYSGQSILDNYWSNFTYQQPDFGDLTDYGVPTTYDEFGNAAYDTSGTNFTSPESTGFQRPDVPFAPDDLGPTAADYAKLPNGTDFPATPAEPIPYISGAGANPWAGIPADYTATLPPSLGGTGPAISGLTDIPTSPGFPSATAANANWSGANDPLPYAWASYAQTNPAAPLPSATDQLAQFTSPESSGQFDARNPDLVNTTATPQFGAGTEENRLPIAARDLSYDSFSTPGAWKFAQPGSPVDWTGDVKNYGDFVAVNIGKVGDWVYGENSEVIALQEQERQAYLANLVETKPAPLWTVESTDPGQFPANPNTFAYNEVGDVASDAQVPWNRITESPELDAIGKAQKALGFEPATESAAPVATPIGETKFNVTAYYPCSSASACPIQGGPASSVKGPDGEAVVRTLDDYRTGKSDYVTAASDKSRYGEKYVIPEVTYKSVLDGKEYTLKDVPIAVHDTGGAFNGRPDKLDIATGRASSDAEAYRLASNQQFLDERSQTYIQYSELPKYSTAEIPDAPVGASASVPLPQQRPATADIAYQQSRSADINASAFPISIGAVERGTLPDITPDYNKLVPTSSWTPPSAAEATAQINEQNGNFAVEGLGGDTVYGPQSQAEVQAVLDANDQRLIDVAREQGLADQKAAEFDATAQAQADLMAQNDAYDAQIAAQQQLKADENRALADRIALAEAQNPAPPTDNRPWWQKLISPTPAAPAVDTKAVALVDDGAFDSGLSKDFNPDAFVSPADQRLIDIARTQGLADQQSNAAAQLADQRAIEFDSTARAQADLMAQNDAYASEVAAQQQLKADENRYLADRIALAEAQNPTPPADNRSWWEKLISPNPTVVDSNIVTSSLAPKPLSTEDDGTIADWNAGYAAVPSTPKASEYYGPEFSDAFGTSPKAIAADVPLPTARPDIVVSGIPLPAARPAAADDAQALSSLNFDYPSNDPIRWELVKSGIIADAKPDGIGINYADSSKTAEYYGPEPTDAFGSNAQSQVKVVGVPLPTARPDIVVSGIPLPTARPDIAESNVPLPLARPEIVVSGIPLPTARPDSAPANLARIALEAGSEPTPSEFQTGIDYSGGTELTTAESDAAFKQFQAQQGRAADNTSYADASESVLVKKRDIIAAGDSGSAENTPEYKAYVAANGVAPANLQQLGEWSDKNPDAVAKQAPAAPVIPSSTWSTAGAITTGKGVVVGGVIGGALTCWTGALCPVGIGVGASLGGYFSNTNESKARTSIEFGSKSNAGDVSTVVARDVVNTSSPAPATTIDLSASTDKSVPAVAPTYRATREAYGGSTVAKLDVSQTAPAASGVQSSGPSPVTIETQSRSIYNPSLAPVSAAVRDRTILNPDNYNVSKLDVSRAGAPTTDTALTGLSAPEYASVARAQGPIPTQSVATVQGVPAAPVATAPVQNATANLAQTAVAPATQSFAYNPVAPSVVQNSYTVPGQIPVSQMPLNAWASTPAVQLPANSSATIVEPAVNQGTPTTGTPVPAVSAAPTPVLAAKTLAEIMASENEKVSDATLVRASSFLSRSNITPTISSTPSPLGANDVIDVQNTASNNGTSLIQLKPQVSVYEYPAGATNAVVRITKVIPADKSVAIIRLGNVLIDADPSGIDALKKAYDEKKGIAQVYVSKSDLSLLELMNVSGIAPDLITVYPVPILPGGIAVQVGQSGDIQEMFTAELLSFGSTENSAHTTDVSYVNWSPGTGQTLVPSALNKGATGALSENENQNAVTAQNTFGGSSASSTEKTSVTGNTLYNLVQTIQSTFSFIFGK